MDYILNFFFSDFGYALLRFALCMLVNWVIIDRLYFKKSRRRDFYFTFMLMSVAIFFLVYFMRDDLPLYYYLSLGGSRHV